MPVISTTKVKLNYKKGELMKTYIKSTTVTGVLFIIRTIAADN
jgi:hypothetical protein